MSDSPTLRALRDAVRSAPTDPGLRSILARHLADASDLAGAEEEYREALRLAPHDESLKLALADVFHRREKSSAALVIVEDLLRSNPSMPRALLLHAKLLLASGAVERAIADYRAAVAADMQLADPAFESRLGLDRRDTRAAVVDGRVRAATAGAGAGDAQHAQHGLERPALTFADVGGMEALKEEIRLKIIHPLAHPELYRAYGKATGGAILLYGPPGCGKTYLARATAGEVKSNFIAVGIDDVLDMWIGQSERRLHELFAQARENVPCVLFFDEVDALAASRGELKASAGRQLINQFLSELDGVSSSNEGVLIMAATNAPWHIDAAFRRPGRFDRMLFVPPPDEPAREEILRLHVRGKPIAALDFAKLAKQTTAFSGADLASVVDVAIERKLAEAIKAGRPQPLSTADLLAAAKSLTPSTHDWFATARNYVLYANQSGFYDAVRAYLKLP